MPMPRPNKEELEQVASIAQQRIVFVDWLKKWKAEEAERLMKANQESFAVVQGRCQVLSELLELLDEAPNSPILQKRG